MFSNLKGLGVMSYGLYLLLNNQISLGAILAVIFLQGNASFLFENIGRFISDVQKSLAGAIRVFEILDMSTENDYKPDLFDNSSLSNRHKDEMIKLENAEFSYKENKVLDNVSLSIAKGSVTALVGPSGGGKSTIIKLIMGFYQLNSGKLIVSEKPVNNYTLEQLRSQIAYVPQNAYLFYGTILENISYGKDNASQEEIIEAAKAANAHDFIMQMPNGYETLVGERGESLSGGQRQRVAIARAILKDSPILLLDEATSALDSESEQLVQDALNKLMKGRTTLVIAHRLTTVTHADKIYVLENGKVVECGTNKELLAKEGLYSKLYKMQFINDTNGSEQI
jgi:ATP-binding cassette subfamily B protein